MTDNTNLIHVDIDTSSTSLSILVGLMYVKCFSSIMLLMSVTGSCYLP